ncbi:hypothetical protein [Capnocytophaga cynodegmi]
MSNTRIASSRSASASSSFDTALSFFMASVMASPWVCISERRFF